jgi:hypothetical protein
MARWDLIIQPRETTLVLNNQGWLFDGWKAPLHDADMRR